MSVICDVLVMVEAFDHGLVMEEVNLTLKRIDPGREQQFKKVDMDAAGGSKFFITDVYAAAFNYLTPSDVLDALAGGRWAYPDEVVVVVNAYDYDEPIKSKTITQIRQEITA